MAERKLMVHVDVDSPLKLARFYRLKAMDFSAEDLHKFYSTSFERALELFSSQNITASFFVVGDELNGHSGTTTVVKSTSQAGHEIENHTYSHPYGLAEMSLEKAGDEIDRCSEVIQTVTGRKPIGFRAPGYSISTALVNLLESKGYRYDSSGHWSLLNPIYKAANRLKYREGLENTGFGDVSMKLKPRVYKPDTNNWMRSSRDARGIWELPIPRSVMGFPFYNNFNLLAPEWFALLQGRMINADSLVYLMHSIEFMDKSDGLPESLNQHPNFRTPAAQKIRYAKKQLQELRRKYQPVATSAFIESLDRRADA